MITYNNYIYLKMIMFNTISEKENISPQNTPLQFTERFLGYCL